MTHLVLYHWSWQMTGLLLVRVTHTARMAVYLRNHAAQVGGRAQMAIEAFADALESIPATIAENAGQDPLDTILEMRHQLMEGKTSVGPDVENGGVCDVLALGGYRGL